MEAMGVTGLTVQNIKSHLQVPHTALRFCSFTPDILASFPFHSAGSEYTLLILVCQRYREKCDLGGQPRQDVLGAASPIMEGHNMYDSLMQSDYWIRMLSCCGLFLEH
jgi:hypothetical protein